MQWCGERKIDMKLRKQALKYNLQFFADAGAGDGGTGADGGNGGDGQGEGEGGQSQSFDDLVSGNKDYQSALDKKIAKALETSKAKWQAESEAKIQEAKTEAEKLAKMNAEQKAKYEQDKLLADLQKREKDVTTRELKAQANITLAEKGMPLELADILNYADADACNASIEAVQKAFQAAIEKGVNDALRGSGAPKGGQGQTAKSTFGFQFQNVRRTK